MRKSRNRTGGRAFTLVELLVVVALTTILTGILLPVIVQAREAARQTTCRSNLRQIGAAFTMYAQDYDEALPYAYRGSGGTPQAPRYQWWWEDDLQPYLRSYRIFVCPSADPITYNYGRDDPNFIAQWPSPLVTTYMANSAHWDSPLQPCAVYRPGGTCTPPLWEAEDPGTPPATLGGIEDAAGTLLVTEGWNIEIWRIEQTMAWRGRPGWNQPYDTRAAGSREGRHRGANNQLYADGHVKSVRTDATTAAMWTRETD